MSDVIGRGVIEVSADSTKLKAGIDDAKKSLKGLGIAAIDATKSQSQSIDRYIKQLGVAAVTTGKTGRELELYRLSLRGASQDQLKAADSALRLTEAYAKGEAIGARINAGLIAGAAAATVAAGAWTTMIISSINAADHLNDLSKTTGISVEQLAGLGLAAIQSGTDLDGVAASVSKLSQNIGKDGDKFRALGITAKEPLEAFKQLADIFVAIEDPQTRAALGSAALGKSWQSAAPLLMEGGKSIGEMVEKGARLSGITQEMAENADKFNDQLEELKATSSGLGAKMAGEMLPAFTDITKAVKLAYEESGKLAALWTGMGALGAFLFTDEFSSAAVKIKNLEGEIRSLEANKKKLDGGGYLDLWLFGSGAEIDAKIKGLKSQIVGLQKGMEPPKAEPKPAADPKVAAKVKDFIREPKDGRDTADLEAKAQLAFDLEQIKKASEAVTSAYANAERIMEARRAASLIDERDYYASKLGFLNLNSAEQEKALQKEIARMQAEQLVGKSKIDNDRKIVDAQARLAKVRADAVANVTVNSIQEEAANKRIAQSYIDATKAAEAYIDTIRRQNTREIDGIGKGEEFRANQAGRSAIEDKQTTQRQGLEGDLRRNQINQEQFDTYLAIVNDTYAKEIAAYDARTAAIKEKQADWLNGASEAFANYQSNAENVAGNSAAMFQQAFDGMTDGVAQSISSAILAGKSLEDSLKNVALNIADAFITSFIKMQIQKMFIDKTAATMYAGTIAAQSQAMVAMAGLAAFASTAAIPIVGPAMAPGAAAAATALAEGFAIAATTAASISIASARGGFDIPAGVNPITQLHEKEMVLPAPQANVIRDLAKNGGETGKGGSGSITIVNNTSAKIGKVTEQRLSNGERALIIQEAVAATAAQFADPNSKASRSLSRNFNVPRSR